MKTISLVLGSGGARGLAHIGVIRWLEEHNYQIKSISGCSSGALIGGVYAAGKLDEFETWVRAIRKIDMVMLLDLSWTRGGIVKGDKFINTLIDLIGNELIEDLPIAFTAVATDITNEKEVWLNSGQLFKAIRASISMPLFFTPHSHNKVKLIDGGVLNPVPIAPTFGDNTDLTIAVNLGGKVKPHFKIDDPQPAPPKRAIDFGDKLAKYIKRLQPNIVDGRKMDWSMYDIASQAFESMQSSIANQKLAAYPPDKLIEIPRSACGVFEVDRASEMIKLGYQSAADALA